MIILVNHINKRLHIYNIPVHNYTGASYERKSLSSFFSCCSLNFIISILWYKFYYQGDSEQALALPSGVLEALQLRTCGANAVVARLQECLSLEPTALEQPDPETKRQIRCLCMKAKTANRLDVVKKLRKIVPSGTTGKLNCFDIYSM